MALDYTGNVLTEITDPFGAETAISYGATSVGARVTQVQRTATGEDTITYAYNAYQPLGITTPTDVGDVVAELDGPQSGTGDVTTFWPTAWGGVEKLKNALGDSTLFERGDATFPREVTTVTHANARADTTEYDAFGRDSTVTIGSLGTAVYDYDDTYHEISSITYPEGEERVFNWNGDGTLAWEEWDGHSDSRITYGYDSNKALRDSVGQGASATTTTFDYLGNPSSIDSELGFTTDIETDSAGRVLRVQTPQGDSGIRVDSTTYDVADRIVRSSTGSSTPRVGTDFVFDSITGALLSTTRSTTHDDAGVNDLEITYEYDGFGRQIKQVAPDGAADSLVYDVSSNVVEHITRRGLVIEREYDDLNRLTREIRPGSTDTTDVHDRHSDIGMRKREIEIPTDTLDFEYDELGNLTVADNGSAEIDRTYGLAGQLESETLKILGFEGSVDRTFVTRYEYDGNGRRIKMFRPVDLAPDGDTIVTYTYDADRGYLKSAEMGPTITWTKDSRGRDSTIAHGSNLTETLLYDGDDRLTNRTVEDGNSTVYIDDDFTYYDDGRKKTITNAVNATSYEYNQFGAMDDFVTEDATQSPPAWSRDEFSSFDGFGNIVWQFKSSTGASGFAKLYDNKEPTYDSISGRMLTFGGENNEETDSTIVETISYDEEGNRTRHEVDFDPGFEQDYLIDVEMFYDAAGFMRAMDRRICELADRKTSWPWFGGRACVEDNSVPSSTEPRDTVFADQSVFQKYRYDALGRRVLIYSIRSDSVGEGGGFQCDAPNCPNYIERVVWDQDRILFEVRYPTVDIVDANDSTVVADLGRISGFIDLDEGYQPFGVVGYLPGPEIDRPYVIERRWHRAGGWQDYTLAIEDGLGFPVAAFDNGGNQVSCLGPNPPNPCAEIEWDDVEPWPSLETRGTNDLKQDGPLLWMGSLATKGTDPTGLLYRRARYYDPIAGQFTQEDPIGILGGLNVYGYAGSDPVNFFDPSGLTSIAPDGCPPCGDGDPGKPEEEEEDEADIGECVSASGVAILSGISDVLFFTGAGAAASWWRFAGRTALGEHRRVARRLAIRGAVEVVEEEVLIDASLQIANKAGSDGDASYWDYVPVVATIRAIGHARNVCRAN